MIVTMKSTMTENRANRLVGWARAREMGFRRYKTHFTPRKKVEFKSTISIGRDPSRLKVLKCSLRWQLNGI
jgi:hypothetical protein